MLKRLLVPILIVVLFMVVSCGDDSPTGPDPVNEFNLVAAVGDVYFTNYTTASGEVNITIQDVFDDLMEDSTAFYIIDYRSSADFNAGHIKWATNMTLTDLANKVDEGTIPTDKTILNVCYTGQTASAATAFLNLIDYDALNLKWGMCGVDVSIQNTGQWTGQIASDERVSELVTTLYETTTTYDFPTTLNTGKEDAVEIIKAKFSAVIAPAWPGISSDDVWDHKDDYFIINYWKLDHYNIGHIPGAYQFTPKESLKSDANLNLLPTDKPIVIYCYTGQTSAQVATYLKILGYEAYSLKFGFNGFAYNAPGYTGGRYSVPAPGIYDAILEK